MQIQIIWECRHAVHFQKWTNSNLKTFTSNSKGYLLKLISKIDKKFLQARAQFHFSIHIISKSKVYAHWKHQLSRQKSTGFQASSHQKFHNKN